MSTIQFSSRTGPCRPAGAVLLWLLFCGPLCALAAAQTPASAKPATQTPTAPILPQLRSAVPAQRLDALAKLAADATLPLPDNLGDMATDRDSRVRIAALRVIAVRRAPRALEILSQALTDSDLSVRTAAIAGLGQLGGDDARAKLIALAGNHAELIRVAAVEALADMQAFEAVRATIGDKSWRVRRAIAKSLAVDSGRQGVAAARQLVTDASGEVQKQVLDSLGKWPLEQAGPLLMTAQRWPAAADFPVDAPAERRREVLGQLQDQWAAQFGLADRASLASAASPPRGDALDAVADTTPLDEIFGTLSSDDLGQRRRASELLAAKVRKSRLSDDEMSRISERMVAQRDPTIWQNVFSALADDPRAESLARAAISHPAADVRRRACEYFGAHGRGEFAPLLLPALEDSQTAVVLAAATALGTCGPLSDPHPLEQALVAHDKRVRLAAAASLTRLGIPSGSAAMERLSYDADENVRRDVATNIGELNDRQFVPTLIRLLDDKLGVKKAALRSLIQVTGRDEGADTIDVAEQVARWKKWYAANPF